MFPRRGPIAASPAVHHALDQLQSDATAEAERLALWYVAVPIVAGLLLAGVVIAAGVALSVRAIR